MGKLLIEGGRKLSGRVKVPGAKNSVLPILAATVISGKKSVIKNCPMISDVEITVEILRDLGCKVNLEGSTIIVDSSGLSSFEVKEELMDKMRSSVVFMGGLTARTKKAKISYPGGCELGLRPIDLHIKGFKDLGIGVVDCHGFMYCDGENARPNVVHLDFPSVGATENLMLAASGIKGKTTIINAAREPEISDLQEFLKKMGVKVWGGGTDRIEIEGAEVFKDVTHTLIPDRIIAATYMAGVMTAGGDITIENICNEHLSAVKSVFCEMGAKIRESKKALRIKSDGKINPVNIIRTSPYPGFPTDAQSVVAAALSVAKGTSIIVENIFDQRFRLCEELIKMGADITVNGQCAVIRGVKGLMGAKVAAPDLRSGAALCVAGIAARGKTEVSNTVYIKRGYEDIARDFRELGADIYYQKEKL